MDRNKLKVGNLTDKSVVERDRPEVARALDELHEVVERYNLLVGRMSDRLQCVTTPASPVCNGPAEEGYTTVLANTINDIRCKLRDITNDLESMYERIEL